MSSFELSSCEVFSDFNRRFFWICFSFFASEFHKYFYLNPYLRFSILEALAFFKILCYLCSMFLLTFQFFFYHHHSKKKYFIHFLKAIFSVIFCIWKVFNKLKLVFCNSISILLCNSLSNSIILPYFVPIKRGVITGFTPVHTSSRGVEFCSRSRTLFLLHISF